MIDINYIENRLTSMGYFPSFLAYFDEPYRHYHTINHVIYLLKKLEDKKLLDNDILFLAAVFHDIIYSAQQNDNEELSAALFEGVSKSVLRSQTIETVRQIILDTKAHQPSSKLSAIFQALDMAILDEPLNILIDYENKIFKEYQFVDWIIYKQKRIEFLKSTKKANLEPLIAYIETRTPNIGVYAGSFNPFHKGHLNILKKSEEIFDKVIVAFGNNPDKNCDKWPVPYGIIYRQIDNYDGLLTDYLNSKEYPLTVIRGLRNTTDYQFELNQHHFLQDLKPDIKSVSIFCEKEFEHISSSSIRMLAKYNKHHNYIIE